uniref:scavenger receptor cysteine-rich domain-containing protein DMBT1-like n=1 Tax=Pristiophorus japonicus TaxID=55135 RepID=UPI00398E52DF
DAELRLSDGRMPCSGRVEVWRRGLWGTVCDVGWHGPEAEVVCRHLGCGFSGRSSRWGYVGRASGPIWLTSVACQGTESVLWDCAIKTSATSRYCSHRSDASVTCRDKPEEPSISVSRFASRFLAGEDIPIECSSRAFYTEIVFHLFKEGDTTPVISMVAAETAHNVTFIIANGTTNDSGYYTCLYQIQRVGVTYNSTRSRFQITVQDKPNVPSIYLKRRNKVYLSGEMAAIDCKSPYFPAAEFYLHEVLLDGTLGFIASSPGRQASFTHNTSRASGEFLYACTYQTMVTGHAVNSTASLPVKILVIDQLPQPRITVESSRTVFAQYRTLKCSMPITFPGVEFRLYKDGKEWVMRNRVSYATFNMLNTLKTNSGNYSCLSQLTVPGHFYKSLQSESIFLATDDSRLRLTNGSNRCSGRVELRYAGEWRRVAYEHFQLSGADLVCAHLGCGFAASIAKPLRSAQGSRTFWLKGLSCVGTEESIWHCNLTPYFKRLYWNLEYDALLNCTAVPLEPTIYGTRTPGLFIEGENVSIQCAAPTQYRRRATFYLMKGGVRPAVPAKVSVLTGDKVSLTLLNVSAVDGGTYVCWYQLERGGHLYNSTWSRALNITVGDQIAKPSLRVKPTTAVFVTQITLECLASNEIAGGTFYFYKDSVNDHVDLIKATRYSKSVQFTVSNTNSSSNGNYTCQQQITLAGRLYNSTRSDPVKVTVAEISQSSALPRAFKSRSQRKSRITQNPPVYTGAENVLDVDGGELLDAFSGDAVLRLVNGKDACSGRVEIFYNGKWGTVCNKWWDTSDGNVVCRHLGCGFVAARPDISRYGPGIGQIWLTHVSCQGSESLLWLCSLQSNSRTYSCSHFKDAAVQCSVHPPRPAISLAWSAGLFLEGETIEIRCQAPRYFLGSQFYLYRSGNEVVVASAWSLKFSYQVSFTLANVSQAEGGTYACGYQVEQLGAGSNSTLSLGVIVTVT